MQKLFAEGHSLIPIMSCQTYRLCLEITVRTLEEMLVCVKLLNERKSHPYTRVLSEFDRLILDTTTPVEKSKETTG